MSVRPLQRGIQHGPASLFYRVELFEGNELTGIEFFDRHQLGEAIERATSAVKKGGANRAEVRDDAVALVFQYPATPSKGTTD